MRRQIVAALIVVQIVGLIFGHRAIKVALKILPHRGVSILVDCEGGRGVLDKYVQQPNGNLAQLRQLRQHVLSNQMKPARARLELDVFL